MVSPIVVRKPRRRRTQSYAALNEDAGAMIGLTSVSHGDDVNSSFVIVNCVDDSIVTASDSP
jgi:hypothetical protein